MSQVELRERGRGTEARGESVYESASTEDLGSELDYYTLEFTKRLLREVDRSDMSEEARILDRDEEAALLAYPDDTLLFVGKDETASNAGVFGFTITPGEPVPVVESVGEALELLQPMEILKRIKDSDIADPVRQGEWWFLETNKNPESMVYKGGVGSKPYGNSPLENHVPRDYGFGNTSQEIMDQLAERTPELAERVDSVQELVQLISENHRNHWVQDYVGRNGEISFRELRREVLGGVFVRGSVRHRSQDHRMVSLGEEWHSALTHGLDVRTPNPGEIYPRHFTRSRGRTTLD